jgi:Ca2+-binding RTX toxin-like protein
VRPAGQLVSYVSADATSLNTLTVRVSGGRIEFRDPTVDGGMDPGSCTPGDVTPDANSWIIQTFCPLTGVRRVRIDLGEREDTAVVALPVPATVIAGPGADRVTVSGAPGELTGGDGNDDLRGGPAGDVLLGGQGADELSGDGGADRIVSRDGVADGVRCGAGADVVDADTFDRVAADCETVTRTLTAPPEGEGPDDGRRPVLDVGATTIQRVGASRRVRVYATSSKRGTISASGFLDVAGLALPVRTDRRRVRVGGGGVMLTYRLRGRGWRSAGTALRKGRRVVVRLGVVATDLAGRSRRRSAPRIRLVRGRAARGARAAHHPEPGDVDGDEVRDELDNCPTTKNGSQVNTDRATEPTPGTLGVNVLGDACDPDDDADGVPDAAPDNCRIVPNPDQTDTDGDGHGDVCPPVDSDADGVIDEDDNCDLAPNPGLSDLDGDDRGDACDRDDDGDRYDDGFDNCPTVWNFDQADRDGDGRGTLCDPDEPVVTDPPRTGARPDRSAPRLAVRVGRRHRLAAVAAGVVVRLRCSEACALTAELGISRRRARRLGLGRTRVVAGGSARLRGAGTTYAFVRFTRRTRRALARGGRVRVALTTTALDDAGNRRRSTRALTLSR